MPHLTLSLLGGFEARLDGQPITTFGTDKARALLAYLAIESGRPHRRSALAALLWPELSAKKAAHNLSQTLLRLRQALREDGRPVRAAQQPFILYTSQDIHFNPLSDYQLDVSRFTNLIKARREHQHPDDQICQVCWQRLQQAVALYRGDLLAGFSLRDSVSFEEWLLIEQELHHRQAVEALAELVVYFEQRRAHDQVQHYARRLAALEPWHGPAQMQLMRALAMDGQAGAALDQYESYRRILAAEFGIKPSTEAAALYRQIKAGEIRPVGDVRMGTRMSSGGAQARSDERRQITALIRGPKAPVAQDDPEALYEEIVRCRQHCEGIFARYGGQRAFCQGDECLIYFGYQEDAARYAVHAGLALIAARQADRPIAIGVHTDSMVVHDDGTGAPEFISAAPGLARECQREAGPGEMILSSTTEHLVHGWFDCENLGRRALRGLAEPVEVYRVKTARSAQSRLDWFTHAQRLSPFVGRASEMTQLGACLVAAQQGHGRVITLSGEPGIGKSRLLWQWKQSLPASVSWLDAQCSPYYQNTALHPIVRLLAQLCGFLPDDAPPVMRDKMIATLARFDLAQAATVWLYSLLLGLPTEAPTTETIAAEQRERMREVFVALLQRQAATQLVVLVIEDLHWSDPTTNEWLDRSFDALTAVPCLAALTFRSTFIPTWLARPAILPITLTPLSQEQAQRLVSHLTGYGELGAEVRQRIVAQTDGVPLFVEEVTKTLLEANTNTGEVAGSTRVVAEIPATLRDSVLARLDSLGAAKEIAQWAAVLGQEFSYAVLHAAAAFSEARLRNNLAQLVAAELISPQGDTQQGPYAFRHALIQEAVYASLLTRTRQDYHRRIADTLAARFPPIVETQPEVLAQHYSQAGLDTEAVEYWLRAGERATAQGATREAKIFFDHALARIRPQDDEQRWRALWGRETALFFRGERAAQRADIAAMLDLAETSADDRRRAQAQTRLARYAGSLAAYRQQMEAAQAAIAAAGRANASALEAEALTFKVTALMRLGERGTLEQTVAQTLAQAQETQDDTVQAYATAAAALYYFEEGNLARAVQLLSQSLEAAKRAEVRHLDLESQYYGHLGFTYAQLGLYTQAREVLEAGLKLADLMGIGRYRAYQMLHLGFVHWRIGDYGTAVRMEEQAFQEYLATGEAFGQAACQAHLGFILEDAGHWDEAEAYLLKASAGFARIGVDADRIETQAVAARCALAKRRQDEARQLAIEVWNYLVEHGNAGLDSPARVYLCLADVFAAVEMPDAAVSLGTILETGYRALIEMAGKISQIEWRQSFLENVVENRVLAARWKNWHAATLS
jgi:predicted ATPase/DNA-binding SARP family transcriptional activator